MWIARIRSTIVEYWCDLLERPAMFSDEWVNWMLNANRRQDRMNALRKTWRSRTNWFLWFVFTVGLLVTATLESAETDSGMAWKITTCLVLLTILVMSAVGISLEWFELTFLRFIDRLSNEGKLDAK